MWYESGVLLGAASLDFWIGDPRGLPHPVQMMGWVIKRYEAFAFSQTQNPIGLKVLGVGLTLLLGLGSGGLTWFLIWSAAQGGEALAMMLQIILLASCFAGRSLRRAAEDVLLPLRQGSLIESRSRLSLYVGRETTNLSEPEILRAVLETVSENSVDGVMAPLFYGLLGCVIPGVGPVPFAIAYKAVSTLDSMVGYREAPYTHLGWFSARSDDVLTWLPCRLTVLTLSFLSGHPFRVWTLCWRDASKDPSPNSGWSECAYAASLGVQLGGINRYRGVVKEKPLIGENLTPITPYLIRKGLRFTRNCFILWMLCALLTMAAVHYG